MTCGEGVYLTGRYMMFRGDNCPVLGRLVVKSGAIRRPLKTKKIIPPKEEIPQTAKRSLIK